MVEIRTEQNFVFQRARCLAPMMQIPHRFQLHQRLSLFLTRVEDLMARCVLLSHDANITNKLLLWMQVAATTKLGRGCSSVGVQD
ncbi:hypothetical protein GQ600_17413 [Phytophthora cactorum]|nr:hypothetical protein GQ600_17413 [Phytophthora cactorum]